MKRYPALGLIVLSLLVIIVSANIVGVRQECLQTGQTLISNSIDPNFRILNDFGDGFFSDGFELIMNLSASEEYSRNVVLLNYIRAQRELNTILQTGFIDMAVWDKIGDEPTKVGTRKMNAPRDSPEFRAAEEETKKLVSENIKVKNLVKGHGEQLYQALLKSFAQIMAKKRNGGSLTIVESTIWNHMETYREKLEKLFQAIQKTKENFSIWQILKIRVMIFLLLI